VNVCGSGGAVQISDVGWLAPRVDFPMALVGCKHCQVLSKDVWPDDMGTKDRARTVARNCSRTGSAGRCNPTFQFRSQEKSALSSLNAPAVTAVVRRSSLSNIELPSQIIEPRGQRSGFFSYSASWNCECRVYKQA
jgi:hypothetical protein